jgi:hypothetical protein
MKTPYAFHILAPFPGTEVRIKADEYNIAILTDDWDLYDANRSVCSTGGITPERVNSIADEFYTKINSSIESLRIKNNNGEILDDMQKELVEGFESFNFNRRLITEKLVEKFRADGQSAQSDFASYITAETGMKESFVKNEVERLIRLRCIEEKDHGTSTGYAWL